jgi:hypothetical protein
MTRRRGFARAARWLALRFALGLALPGVLALCGAPSEAFEPPLGSKNFTSPSFVPDYFSNEAAPFGRGSQAAQPAADRFNTAPVATSGAYAAAPDPSRDSEASAGSASYRGTLAHSRTGRGKSASSRTARAHHGGARGGPVHAHSSARAASRSPAATTGRAAAARSSRGGRSAGHVRQASR